VVILACLLCANASHMGVDLSQECLIDGFKCLSGKGFTHAIIRAWRSDGEPDPVGPHTIYNAWDGNMTKVDVYIFPCYSCGDPAGQIKYTIANLTSFNANYGTVWLDIEGAQYWDSNTASNADFFQKMVDQAGSLGLTIGVYTSESQWEPIMGSYTGGKDYPLWYAHYDNDPSVSDFSPFGGWSSPYMKQYAGTTSMCGCSVDLNYSPEDSDFLEPAKSK